MLLIPELRALSLQKHTHMYIARSFLADWNNVKLTLSSHPEVSFNWDLALTET